MCYSASDQSDLSCLCFTGLVSDDKHIDLNYIQL